MTGSEDPQAGASAPALPWQQQWVIFALLFGTPALWNYCGWAHCNFLAHVVKVHRGRREHWNKHGASEQSQLAGRLSSLGGVWTSAMRLPMQCWLINIHLPLPPHFLLSTTLTKQHVFTTSSEIKRSGGENLVWALTVRRKEAAFFWVSAMTPTTAHMGSWWWLNWGKNKNDKWVSEIVDWCLLAQYETMLSSGHRLEPKCCAKNAFIPDKELAWKIPLINFLAKASEYHQT